MFWEVIQVWILSGAVFFMQPIFAKVMGRIHGTPLSPLQQPPLVHFWSVLEVHLYKFEVYSKYTCANLKCTWSSLCKFDFCNWGKEIWMFQFLRYPLLLGWHKILHLEMFLHHRHVNLALVFAKTFLLHCWLVCQVGKCQGWTCLLVCCHIVCQTSENSGNSGHLGLSIKPTQLIPPLTLPLHCWVHTLWRSSTSLQGEL